MKKMLLRGFAIGLVMVLAALAPACRSTKKKTVTPTTTVATDTAPAVPVVPETKVDTQPPDFVQEPKTTVEELPRDIDALNRVVQDKGLIRDAFFGYDESTLTSQAQEALTTSANWLKANPNYNVLIEGHCDERGTEQYNLALGDRRASMARDYLITLGVDAGRLRTVSYGEERPFDSGHSEEAWAVNRRAHLVLVSR